jgi:hypothetical protein
MLVLSISCVFMNVGGALCCKGQQDIWRVCRLLRLHNTQFKSTSHVGLFHG